MPRMHFKLSSFLHKALFCIATNWSKDELQIYMYAGYKRSQFNKMQQHCYWVEKMEKMANGPFSRLERDKFIH